MSSLKKITVLLAEDLPQLGLGSDLGDFGLRYLQGILTTW